MKAIRDYVATMALGSLAVATTFAGLMFSPSDAEARLFRVLQVPNGSVNLCLTCHAVPLPVVLNGPRNPFGMEIEANFLDVPGELGNVQWGAVLAALDSDGDGETNGTELNDPDGTLFPGEPNPGDPADVTNPGAEPGPQVALAPIGSPWMIATLVSALTGAGYAITRRSAGG